MATANATSKRANRLIRGVASLVLGVLALLALFLVLLGIFARPGSDGISRIAGHPILKVLSGSMRGVFNPGDMIIDNQITSSQAQQLATGNIITFHVANTSSTNLITHRIVAVHNENGQLTYQTKGDANNAPDPEAVTPSQIVGTYHQRIPYAGYLLQWAQQKTIFFLLIVVPLAYLVVLEIAKHWNEPKKDEDKSVGASDDSDEGVHAVGESTSADIAADGVVTSGTDASGVVAAMSVPASDVGWTAETRQPAQHSPGAAARRRSSGGRRRA